MPQYLSLKEAADTLGLAQRTVRRMIARGDLNAYRVGRQIRIKVADLDRLPTVIR